jgi:hypothetical protein
MIDLARRIVELHDPVGRSQSGLLLQSDNQSNSGAFRRRRWRNPAGSEHSGHASPDGKFRFALKMFLEVYTTFSTARQPGDSQPGDKSVNPVTDRTYPMNLCLKTS